jgi:hypothetical protein
MGQAGSQALPPVQPTVDEQLTQGGITKMIVPTIMQCNMGGYLVSMPGVGTFAASTIEEIMAFVEQRTLEHFKAKRSEFPKVVREKLVKAKEDASDIFGRLGEGAKRVDVVMISIVLAGLLVGWAIFGGFDEPRAEQRKSFGNTEPTKGSSLPNYLGGSGYTHETRPAVLPEVHMRRVRTTPDDREAQRLLQDSEVRGMLPPN